MPEPNAQKDAPLVVAIGEALWDELPSGRRPGGAPANCAAHADALGARAALVSRVGAGESGHELRRVLESAGIDAEHVSFDPDHVTGRVTVAVDEVGRPTFTIHGNSAWDYIEFTRALAELARAADAVCFGTLAQRSRVSRATIRRVVTLSPVSNLRVCDLNLRPPFVSREVVEASLGLANVLKLNAEELATVCDMLSIGGDAIDALPALADAHGLDLVALTDGERGSRLYARGEISNHWGIAVDVVDTVGAGDAFTAALIVGRLRGMELDELNAFAGETAARACTHAGAFPETG